MTPQDFIQSIRAVVLDTSQKGVLSVLTQPPGRKPKTELVALSKWFHSLTDEDKKMVTEVIKLASHQAVFGLLAVVDGVRRFEAAPNEGKLELRYVSKGEKRLLNDPAGPMLHEILNSSDGS